MEIGFSKWLVIAGIVVAGCAKEPPPISSRRGLPMPMIGRTNSQPILVDVQFAPKGEDGIATVTVTNRGTNSEVATINTFEVYGVETTTKLPIKLTVHPRDRKVIKLTFPGQKSADYNHATFSYEAKGVSEKVQNGPEPSVLFLSGPNGTKTVLQYDSDFSERVLEVQITSVIKDGKEVLTAPIKETITPGTQVTLPIEIPRPATVKYQVRLHGNQLWKPNSILLDAIQSDVGTESDTNKLQIRN